MAGGLGAPVVGLFPVGVCRRLPDCLAWGPGPGGVAAGAVQQSWGGGR